jgi:hypothetical protein
MKHTPTPWHAGQGNGSGSIFAEEGRMRFEEGGTTLYPICTVHDFDGEREANIELIERAVNCHDALVATVSELLEVCRWKCGPFDEVVLKSGRSNEAAMVAACELLKKSQPAVDIGHPLG